MQDILLAIITFQIEVLFVILVVTFFKQSINSNHVFSLVHLSISQSFLFIPEIKHYVTVD